MANENPAGVRNYVLYWSRRGENRWAYLVDYLNGECSHDRNSRGVCMLCGDDSSPKEGTP